MPPEAAHFETHMGSRLAEIPEVRRWALDHARAAGFAGDDLFAVEVALAEALSNVVRHAYDNRPGHEITVRMDVAEDRVRIVIEDRGRPFDREAWSPPAETAREGGYGVKLIEDVMDEVDRRHEGGGTALTLVRYRREEQG